MSTARTREYLGSELALFAEATNWRAYWQRQVSGFLGRQVLEVGAGIGSVTRSLCGPDIGRWVALEPDREMAAQLSKEVRDGRLPPACEPHLVRPRGLPGRGAAGRQLTLTRPQAAEIHAG